MCNLCHKFTQNIDRCGEINFCATFRATFRTFKVARFFPREILVKSRENNRENESRKNSRENGREVEHENGREESLKWP